MRLIPVESGFMTADAGVLCEGASGNTRFPVCCWVIEHPRGTVIFDTGLHAELLTDPGRMGDLSSVFAVEMKHDLGSAIAQQGVDPANIDYIVFSHLHFDHSGGTAAIPNAGIIVQADEWQAGHSDEFVASTAYRASDFDLGHDVTKVQGLHDIFGDGSVVCIPTPGHTAGHQSLKVELDSGSVLLVGDCCYWRRMLEEDLLPPFGFDREQQRESMKALRKHHDEGVRLIFGHDAEQWAEIELRELT